MPVILTQHHLGLDTDIAQISARKILHAWLQRFYLPSSVRKLLKISWGQKTTRQISRLCIRMDHKEEEWKDE
jgi:hypothetical protein